MVQQRPGINGNAANMQNISQNTVSDHNISAKLPIQPSFVPSIGCFSSHNNTSKISLNNTSSNLNLGKTTTMQNDNMSHSLERNNSGIHQYNYM